MKVFKIGMRTVKTVLAVILTLIIADLLKLRSPVLAGIAAIMTMESSVSESFVTGRNRMYGTILGGLVAILISYLNGNNIVSLSLGLIFIIKVTNYFKWNKATRMSMVVFLVIVLGYEEGARLSYGINRTIDTLTGVVVGTGVNYFIRPPRVYTSLNESLKDSLRDLERLVYNLIWQEDFSELSSFIKGVRLGEEKYRIFLADRKYNLDYLPKEDRYNNLFDAFNKVINHFIILDENKKTARLNSENHLLIEDYYKRTLLSEKEEDPSYDLIYNYHLEKILKNMKTIRSNL